VTLRDDILGTWELNSYNLSDRSTRLVKHPLGTDATGLLVYSADGYMSVQIMRARRTRYDHPDTDGGSAAQTAAAASGYLAYSGPFDVDESTHTLRHHTAVSLIPNWLDGPLLRQAAYVTALVYVAAFGLDEGESIDALLEQGPPTPALAHLQVDDRGGFACMPHDDFVGHIASDIDAAQTDVMFAVQQPLSMSALGDVMSTPAWKNMPSWYAVATNDEAIPPDTERMFAHRMKATTIELPSGHVAMVSTPTR
jgi:hypothetical protein